MTTVKSFHKGAVSWIAFLLVAALLGCGGGKGPSKSTQSARKQLDAASGQIELATTYEQTNQAKSALDAYKQALQQIQEGLAFAQGNDRRKLYDMQDNINRGIVRMEQRIKAEELKAQQLRKQEEQQKQLAELQKAQGAESQKAVDPQVLERQERAKAEAALKEAQAAASAAAAVRDTAKIKDGDYADAAQGKELKQAAAKAAEEGEGEGEGPKEPVPVGPAANFKNLGPNPKELSVDHISVEQNGRFALAYIQLNSNAGNKHIARILVSFKDANNNTLIDEYQTATFDFKKFNFEAGNLMSDQPGEASVVGGTHQVIAGEPLKLIAVGEYGKAGLPARATVKVIYTGGSEVTVTGPAEAVKTSRGLGGILGD